MPDNGQAVVGFVFSIVAVGLLVISFGLSSIVSVGCSITGIVCSRNGKRKVERGETPKHKGLAQAGYIVGWVGLALSILATAGWILRDRVRRHRRVERRHDPRTSGARSRLRSGADAILARPWRIPMSSSTS